MSTRASRSKRRSAAQAPEEDDEPEVLETEEPRTQRRGSKRRSVSQTPEDAADGGDDPATLTPAAAAAGAQGAAGRVRQQRVQFSQQEANQMTEVIQQYEEAAQDALDRAVELGVPQTNIEVAVAKVVRFMLFRQYEKPDVPVKRQDLTELVKADHKHGRGAAKLPSLVIAMAAAKLASAFGLELHEIKKQAAGQGGRRGGPAAAAAAAASAAAGPSQAAAGAAAEGGGGGGGGAESAKMYVLRSLLPSALLQRFVQDPADDSARGLITVVLALLQLGGGQMEEEELWRHLENVGVSKEDKFNAFGRGGAAGLLSHMDKAKYLVIRKQPAANGSGMQTMLELGEAAQDEFGANMKALVDKWLGSSNRGLAGAAGGGA